MTFAMRIVAAIFALGAAAAAGQVFKWTDAQGKTHYGDRPPEESAAKELAVHVPSYDGPVQVTDWGAILRRKPAAAAADIPRAGITMYSTSWCPHCKRARAYFAARGIAVDDVDIEKSAPGRKAYQALGGGGVPIIVAGERMMRGFSPQAFESLRASR